MRDSTLIPLFCFGTLLISACNVPGERASDVGRAACPASETCSDLTPHGLFFQGTPPSDQIFAGGLLPTALGGTQTVTALNGLGSGDPPFAGAFDAVAGSQGIFAIDAVTPPSVKVRGEAQGGALLRLLEPGTTRLLDRVELEVAPIEKVTLLPLELAFINDSAAPWALLAGSTPALVVGLAGKDQAGADTRLVDEALALTADSGAATRKKWDLFEILTPSSGEVSFHVQAGGRMFPVKAPVVSSIDDIAPVGGQLGTDRIPIDKGFTLLGCFAARSGSAFVGGATWDFEASSGAEIMKDPSPAPETTAFSACAFVRGVSAGPAQLTVKANGIVKTFAFTVVQPAPAPAPAPARSVPAQDTQQQRVNARLLAEASSAGERASLEGGR